MWKQMMPVFPEIARLDYFKTEINAGRKQYKDFYVYFRKNLLEKFDDTVAESQKTEPEFGSERLSTTSIGLKYWRELPWEIRVKTYLTLYSVEMEAQKAGENELSEREINVLRWVALLLHIGCAKPSKTSKVHVYSFLSALFIIQMLESGDIAQELLEGSGYRQIPKPRTSLVRNSGKTDNSESERGEPPALIHR